MMLLDGPTTARDLLFDSNGTDHGSGVAVELDHALDGIRPGTLSSSVRQTIQRDVTDAIGGLLELDLADVLVSGWRKHSQLRAAGKRTLAEPGTRETVVLAEHRISYEAHPYVDVVLDVAPLTRVELTLQVTMDVTGLEASISDGRLNGLSAGRAVVAASLQLAGAPVARRSREVRLPAEISLGDGLRLA